MSKKGKGRRNAKARKQRPVYKDFSISRLGQHARHGGKLSPPLNQIPGTTKTSWSDDHMPEMLWAVLLTGTLERQQYLECFRRVANLCKHWFEKPESGQSKEPFSPNHTIVVDQTGIAGFTDAQFEKFIRVISSYPLSYAALRPLLRIESLPGKKRWKNVLNLEPGEDDWTVLAHAIAGVLDHQSEASTDIRWFKLIFTIISGHMFFPQSMGDLTEELRLFPDKGDMRKVRPFIRSGEMMLRRIPSSPWVQSFWDELLGKTRCVDPTIQGDYPFGPTTIEPNSLYDARHQVIQRFLANMKALRADARLDSAFGLVLYVLSILEEVGRHHLHTLILGRLALRSLVEANITLRYLAEKDNDDLWKSYRVYGAGQAKLAFLKAQELQGELPTFLDQDALHTIANEDVWQEYLDIEIGHWANSNLRKLAIESGAKELYDKYYDWASTFTHSHWGAVRDTNFLTCHNALHRLHRIPRLAHRRLNTIEVDSVGIVNEMLERLDKLYPSEAPLGKVGIAVRKQNDGGANP
jgi:hypothetical protein